MSEFFRGWRRKIGVVILVTACLLAMGWVRSLVIGDQVAFEIHQTFNNSLTENHFLTSKNGCLRWIRYGFYSNGVNPTSVDPLSIWTVVPLDSSSEPFDEFKDTSVHLSIAQTRKKFRGEHYWHWRWQWLQFDFGKGQAYGDAPMLVWVVPYWSITITMAILAAFLILSKSRASTQKKITEPVQDEGAAT